MRRLTRHQHELFLPVACAVTFLWVVLGPGWPIGWATYVPAAIVAAYAIGWLRGERNAWEHQLRQREREVLRLFAVAHVLGDAEFEPWFAEPQDRQHTFVMPRPHRDQAMWN